MFLIGSCIKCNEKLGREGRSMSEGEWALLDMNDSGEYEFVCSKGHKNILLDTSHKYERLYDRGIFALYHRNFYESISCFSAAMERMFEFYVRIVSIKYVEKYGKTIVENQKPIIDELWNKNLKLTEREFGAFCILYMIETGKVFNYEKPKIDSKEFKKFRNDVLHNGYIPKKEETEQFAECVFNTILIVLRNMKSNPDNKNNITRYPFHVMKNKFDENKEYMNIRAGQPYHFLGIDEENSVNFQERYEHYKSVMEKWSILLNEKRLSDSSM